MKKMAMNFLIHFLLFVCPTVVAPISLGSILSASKPNQIWSSFPNNTFALHFIPQNPPTSPPTFLAAITYSDGVPIWSAGAAAAVSSDGSFHFRPDGNLCLLNASNAILWESSTAGIGVSSATLDDSGNLVLYNGTLKVWSSFENPTDTIVPSQDFSHVNVLRSGLYSFGLLSYGNLTLRWNESVVYWNAGLNSSINDNPWHNSFHDSTRSFNVKLTDPILRLQDVGILSISERVLSSPVIMAYSSDYGEDSDRPRFLRLGSDGNLSIYSYVRGTKTVTRRWAAVTNQCEVFGFCGNLGVCSYNDSYPVCGCPSKNFVPIDAKNRRKGCRRKVEIEGCPGNKTMLVLKHARFLTYPPEVSLHGFSLSISECRTTCLLSGSCVASTSLSDGTGLCYLKSREFVSGYQSPTVPGTSYVKVCGPVDPNMPPSLDSFDKKSGSELHVGILVVLAMCSLLCFIVLEGGLWWWCCRKRHKFRELTAQYAWFDYASGAPIQFCYKELQRSTKGFREKLGAGGFGAVYKGSLARGTVVAVKQLEGIDQGQKQFRMEIATISSTHHLNLVRLIGFCSEGRHRLLVYEFMKNGSLDNFLFTKKDQLRKPLSWECRLNIALGTARGITYLHEECHDCIVHCDIKPENILLDEEFRAKISDFGLAKLINHKENRYQILSSVRGTRGYLAPEWIANLPITSKSDIYSYGMVLLELVSGRRNFDISVETNWKKFSLWAYDEFQKGNVNAIVDKALAHQDVNMEQVYRAIRVSFWCIQEQPSHRPMMGRVVQMLEGITEIHMPPAPKDTTGVLLEENNLNVCSDINAPNFAASASAQSISSPYPTAAVSRSALGRNFERSPSSPLLS